MQNYTYYGIEFSLLKEISENHFTKEENEHYNRFEALCMDTEEIEEKSPDFFLQKCRYASLPIVNIESLAACESQLEYFNECTSRELDEMVNHKKATSIHRDFAKEYIACRDVFFSAILRVLRSVEYPIHLIPKDKVARGLNRDAIDHFEQEEIDEAFQKIEQSLDVLKLERTYRLKGDFYSYQDELDKAIPEYQKALALDSKNSETLARLGNAYDRMGDDHIETAIAYYKKAAKINSDYFGILYFIEGEQQMEKGNLEKAQKAFLEANNYGTSSQLKSLEILLQISENLGDKKTLAKVKKLQGVWEQIYLKAEEERDSREIADHVKELLELEPNNPYYNDYYTSYLMDMEEFQEARIYCEKSLSLMPNSMYAKHNMEVIEELLS